MRRLFVTLFLLLLLTAVAAQGVLAHDFWNNWADRPWERGDEGSTHQIWEFSRYEPTQPWSVPNVLNNPYGTPWLEADGQFPDVVPGPDGIDIPTLHLGHIDDDGTEVPGILALGIPNSRIDNPMKLIYVQITADKGTYQNSGPTTQPEASDVSSPGPIIKHGPTGWYTYNWLIEINPNPDFETINFTFPYSTNISQVVVDTICIVPEPSSLAVLGSGALAGLFSLRRRAIRR